MRYLITFGLLLLLVGCSQQTPLPEVVPLTKKPAGIETLQYKTEAEDQDDDLKTQEEMIEEVVPASSAVVEKADEVVEIKVPVAKTPEEIAALSAAAEAKAAAKKKKQEALKKEDPKQAATETKSTSGSKTIIGAVELIRLIPGDVVRKARIDTGAQTTSIDATDVQSFERDGETWVRFRLGGLEDAPLTEKPVSRVVQIKRHGEESQDRFVVKMRLILGERSQVVEVSLTDRSQFTYPILIGRNFLRDFYIVDVGAKLTSKPIEYEK